MKEVNFIKDVSEPNCLLDSLCDGDITRLTGAECDDRLLFGRSRNLCTVKNVKCSRDRLALTDLVGIVCIRVVDKCREISRWYRMP